VAGDPSQPAHVAEAGDWWQVITGPIEPPPTAVDDAGYLLLAVDTLEAMPWGDEPWPLLTASLKEAPGARASRCSCRSAKP
jgi:glutamyl-tRNA synthetase